MGCDIHGWVEERVGDKWVAVCELTDEGKARNYRRFAALAGVRGDGPAATGVPEDVSDTVRYWIDYWGNDGHSHSSLPMSIALPAWAAPRYPEHGDTKPEPDPLYKFFGLYDMNEQVERRVVFWFDN